MTDDIKDQKDEPGQLPPGVVEALPEAVRAALAAQATVTTPQAADLLAQPDAAPKARLALGIPAEDLAVAQQILATVLPVLTSTPSAYAEIPLGVPVAPASESPADAPEFDGEDCA